MPYKTKFREVRVPKNAKEIGTDANSMRSFGAAIYREISSAYHVGVREKIITDGVIEGTLSIMESYIGETDPKYSSHIQRQLRYFLQGVQRAAKTAGDEKTIEYVSRKLVKLK